MANEVERALLDLELDVDGAGFRVEPGPGLNRSKIEASIRVVAFEDLYIFGEMRTIEDLTGLEFELGKERAEVHRFVASDLNFAHAELWAFSDRDLNRESLFRRVDDGFGDLYLQIPDVAVLLFDAAKVPHKDAFGIGPGLVEPRRGVRPRPPQFRGEVLLQLTVVELLVAHELDGLES